MTQKTITKKPPTEIVAGSLCFVSGRNPVTINEEVIFLDPKSIHNAGMIIDHHEKMKGGLIYDIFADDILLTKCPPWENEQTFLVHPWRDEDTTNFRMWLETIGMKIGKNDVADSVSAVAKRHVVNPPKDYFESLKWDGKPRLNKWLCYYAGCTYNDPEYLELIGSKWMIAIVNRVYEPGAKFDTALLLEGKEYAGKSTVFSTLATIGDKTYFTDEHIDFDGKEGSMILQGKLIYEMAELANWRTASNEKVKAWVSRRADIYRPPYGRRPIERPRMFVLAGSLNPNGGIFHDSTGNRRYWIARAGKILLEQLKEDCEQLWAEAVVRYKNKERVWLIGDEFEKAKTEQDMRFDQDILAGKIEDSIQRLLLKPDGFATEEILNDWGIPIEQRSNNLKHRIINHLTFIGYEMARPRTLDKRRPCLWIKKEEDKHKIGD